MRKVNLENFQQTVTTDTEHLKESVTQNESKCVEYQRSCEKKLKKIKGKLADLNQKEEEINDKLKELATKDLYLEAFSRRKNIKGEGHSRNGIFFLNRQLEALALEAKTTVSNSP